MKVIKYWQVLLFRISQPSSIINDRKPIETLVFVGYSKEKPNIKLGTGLSIELFTAPDSLETQIINGGQNGIDDRRARFLKAKSVLV